VPWCTIAMMCDWCRQQVSILWPSAYEAITISLSDVVHIELDDRRCLDALPLSYTGWGVFAVATRGIRTRHLWLVDMSFANWAMSASSVRTAWSTCSVIHILTCRFLDDPLIQTYYSSFLYIFFILLLFSLFNPSSIFNPSIHHPWHPFNTCTLFLSSFLILQTSCSREIQNK